MFSFLNPWFLAAAGAALAPLILHMIQSSRTVRQPFSTIRFLKLAERRSSRRARMEHFLLWLLRTLVLLLLALAFAMPMVRRSGLGGLLGRSRRDVALVVDVSYSMDYRVGRRTVWERAREAALAVLDGLEEQDRVCVFLAGETAIPLLEQLTADKDLAREALRRLEARPVTSRLGHALAAAQTALDSTQGRTEREIHIISDNQEVPWRGLGKDAQGRSGWDPAALERTVLFVTLLGTPAPENTAPADVTLEPDLIAAGIAARVTVRVAATGPARDGAATLSVDGVEVNRRALRVGAGQAARVDFALPPLTPGTHVARIDTPEDSLPADDAFHVLVRVREALPVLCVGEPDDTLFLRTALGAGGRDGAAMRVERIAAARLTEIDPGAYACIVLCNALPLPGDQVTRLEDWVAAGNCLALFPGDRAKPEDYAAWRCLPGVPSAVQDLRLAERRQVLRWERPPHPLLGRLGEEDTTPLVTLRRRLVWDGFRDGAAVVAWAGAEMPFLVTAPYGRGAVVLAAVSADRGWSDFPLSPYYLPLVHQVTRYAAGVGVLPPYITTAAELPLALHVPGAARGDRLLRPDGAAAPIRGTVVEGRTELRAEGIDLPGIYTLAAAGEPAAKPVLAVNMDRAESDLTPIDPATVTARLGAETVFLADSVPALERLIEAHRVGKTLGEPLLWLALILAALECVYANLLLRPKPKLSERLDVQASGKVAGGRGAEGAAA
jgi:hypothetical protein